MPTLLGRDYQIQELETEWGQLAEARLNLLGTTAIIFPFGDPLHGQPNAATFTSIGEEQLVCTWSEAPTSFDTPLTLTESSGYQGIIPVVSFNGTDEEFDTPDAAALSFDDSGANPVSFIFWVNADASASDRYLVSKDVVANNREYFVSIVNDETVRFTAIDDSADAVVSRITDDAITTGAWHQLAITYNSAGGAAAMNGVTIYVDGAPVASTATNNGSYVAMEDLTSVVTFNARSAAPVDKHYPGKCAGGPLGYAIVGAELTADVILRDYQLGRRALNL